MAWFWNRSVRSITCRPDEISYLIDESVRRQPTPLAKAVYLSKQGPLQKYWSTGVAEWWRQHGKEIANASKNLLLAKHAVSILELHGYSDDKSLPHMQELQTIFKSLQLTFEGSYGTPKRVAEQIEIYERITAGEERYVIEQELSQRRDKERRAQLQGERDKRYKAYDEIDRWREDFKSDLINGPDTPEGHPGDDYEKYFRWWKYAFIALDNKEHRDDDDALLGHHLPPRYALISWRYYAQRRKGDIAETKALLDQRRKMIPTVSTFTARIEIPPVHRRAVFLFLNMSQNERAIVEANRLDENVYDTEPRHSPGDIARIEDELDAIFRERFIDTLPLTREEEDEGIGWDRIQRESTRRYLEEYKMELRKLTWQRTLYNYLEYPYIREFDTEREAVLHADKLETIVTKIRNDIRRYANKGFTRVSKS